jgi:hypothetical protein
MRTHILIHGVKDLTHLKGLPNDEIGIKLGGQVNPQRDHQGIEEEKDVEKMDFQEIGRGKEVGDEVGEEVKKNEQRRKELGIADALTKKNDVGGDDDGHPPQT